MNKHLFLLGTRGVPAKHGGFETFAEKLCLYLINRGWKITVYCQNYSKKKKSYEKWENINKVNIYVKNNNPLSTIIFDFKSILHASKQNGIFLILGYNTAIFSLILKIKKKFTLINMDGIEWKRDKWSLLVKIWFYINEYLAIKFNNFYIADNPYIQRYLSLKYNIKNLEMIPYGSETKFRKDNNILKKLKLKKKKIFNSDC